MNNFWIMLYWSTKLPTNILVQCKDRKKEKRNRQNDPSLFIGYFKVTPYKIPK